MIEILFYLCIALILYVYAGYPACIVILSKLITKPVNKDDNYLSVSILISAYNEEQHITETINNKLSLDYPQALTEIIVISDGSTDKTDAIVESYADKKVRLIRQDPRQGKTVALNKAITEANGDIIVFSDANSIYQTDALKQIIRNFDDPSVGYVTGRMVYVYSDGSLIGSGCSTYMRYENLIRYYESNIGSVVGVDGGIDAVRKDLYIPMSPDQLPDFVLPLRIVEQNFRVIYEPAAILKEEALNDEQSEYKMRTRVALRSLWAIWYMRVLLNPCKYPLYSWQLLSHKLLRYLAWAPLAIVFLLNVILLQRSQLYIWIFILQLLFYTFSLFGHFYKKNKNIPIIFSAPYYFALVNIASAQAFVQFIRGKKQILWTPRVG